MKRASLIMLALILLLMGCGGQKFKPDTFSQDDMCIVKTKGKAKVCFGMSRSEVESVLGTGAGGDMGASKYDDGVQVFYRNEAVAGVVLDKDAKGVFKTARGVEIGMPMDAMKKLHGETYPLGGKEFVMYIYHSKNNEFLDEKVFEQQASLEEMEKIYALSTRFDLNDETINMIYLYDLKMGTYFF